MSHHEIALEHIRTCCWVLKCSVLSGRALRLGVINGNPAKYKAYKIHGIYFPRADFFGTKTQRLIEYLSV